MYYVTLAQANFLADNFRDYCTRYNHMPVFFPVYEKCKSIKTIRENPAGFSRLIDAFISQIMTEKRNDPDYSIAFDTLCEIRYLCNNPREIAQYLDPEAIYHNVHEYALAVDTYRKSK